MKKIFLALLLFLGTITSCKNAFEEMADINTAEAILYQAKLFLAEGLWTEAIAEFERLPADVQAQESVKVEHASAYAGRCGLDFLTLADVLGDYNPSTKELFQVFLDVYSATTGSNLTDCQTAETMLKTMYSASTGVVAGERGQFLMAMSSIAKVGAIMSFRADADNNDTVNAGWNPCDAGTGLTDLPDAEVNEIITAISLFRANINAIYGSDPDNPFSTITDELDDVCSLEPTLCTTFTTTSTNALQRIGVRAAIVETDDGYGLNIEPGDIATNALSCP